MSGIDALYRLMDAWLPTWLVALIALLAVISSIAHAILRKHPRALILAAGALSVVFIYFWLVTAQQTTSTQRVVAIKIAVIAPLLSIALFNEQAWPWLSRGLQRGWRRFWGGG